LCELKFNVRLFSVSLVSDSADLTAIRGDIYSKVFTGKEVDVIFCDVRDALVVVLLVVMLVINAQPQRKWFAKYERIRFLNSRGLPSANFLQADSDQCQQPGNCFHLIAHPHGDTSNEVDRYKQDKSAIEEWLPHRGVQNLAYGRSNH